MPRLAGTAILNLPARAGASEFAVEQARAASSPWADQPAPGLTAQPASGTQAFGVKSLGAIALCRKAPTLCHRNRSFCSTGKRGRCR